MKISLCVGFLFYLDLFMFKFVDDWLKDEDNVGNVSYIVYFVNEDEVVYCFVILNKMMMMCLWGIINKKWFLNF